MHRALPLLIDDDTAPDTAHAAITALEEIPDDRLRLICTCCHPALSPEAQVALTLRLVCGLTTAEVAHAFLVAEPTMAARITRAKKKIAAARIPYRVPGPRELPERIEAVLAVVHLLFTTGHTAPSGESLIRRDLIVRAADLARMLHALLPENDDVAGLLALILLTDARRVARTADDGAMLRLSEQDRGRWDRAQIAEGIELVRTALSRNPGRYALQAAIAAVHAEAPSYDDTDWREIAGLYDVLIGVWPSPVVALNRAVAIGMAQGPTTGLAALDALAAEPQLAGYGYLAAARAHFLTDSAAPPRPAPPTRRPSSSPRTPPSAPSSPPGCPRSTRKERGSTAPRLPSRVPRARPGAPRCRVSTVGSGPSGSEYRRSAPDRRAHKRRVGRLPRRPAIRESASGE